MRETHIKQQKQNSSQKLPYSIQEIEKAEEVGKWEDNLRLAGEETQRRKDKDIRIWRALEDA